MTLEALGKFPRVRLWEGATPLEPQHNLAMAAGAAGVLVKRDDCNGLAFGGNKVRQLEYYIGDAVHQGADTVLMTGAVQSNFVRTAAAACCKLGLACHIQLEDRVPKDSDEYRHSGNVLLNEMLGATLHYHAEGEDEAGADRHLKEIAEGLKAQGRKPYVVQMHPSHPPLGALGYIHAAEELVDQLSGLAVQPDEIFVASGSGNTHGGLLYGLRALGCQIPVTGICVRRAAGEQVPRIARRCEHISELLGERCPVSEADVAVTDEFLAPGYGRAGPEAIGAIKLAARTEALILDPVYTGKVMAALLRSAGEQPGRSLVFIHTGGGPAIFGYASELRQQLSESA